MFNEDFCKVNDMPMMMMDNEDDNNDDDDNDDDGDDDDKWWWQSSLVPRPLFFLFDCGWGKKGLV